MSAEDAGGTAVAADTGAAADSGAGEVAAPEAAAPATETLLSSAEGTATDEGGAADANATVPKAPESYADFTFGEGVNADAEVLEAFKGTAKEFDLSQEQAQRVADMGGQLVEKAVQSVIQQQAAEIDKWGTDFKAEQGSDEITARALRSVNAHLSPETVEMINKTGIGNFGPFIKDLAKLDALTQEDQSVGGSSPGGELDPAKVLFPGFK